MGGVSVPGAGGKRSYDAEINLVPFIDMMSCLLSFLMLTVVWNRMAKIDVKLPEDNKQKQQQDPQEDKKNLALFVDKDSFVVGIFSMTDGNPVEKPATLKRVGQDMPTDKLKAKLAAFQEALPKDKEGRKHATIIVAGKDRVPYTTYMAGIDACNAVGLTSTLGFEGDPIFKKLLGLPDAP